MYKIRNFFVKIALFFVKLLKTIVMAIVRFFAYLGKGLNFIVTAIGRYLLLPIYKVLHNIKRRVLNVYSPARSRVFLLLTKKYIPHVLIVAMSFTVVSGNLRAQETRDESFGEQMIINQIVGSEFDDELVEEQAIFDPQEKILSYMDQSGQIGNMKTTESPVVSESQLAEDLAAITEGGSAVVKPTISEAGYPSSARFKVIYHTVEGGETISTIAEKYGVSQNTILWANGLSAKSTLSPGQPLKILPITGVEHTVKKGDTLSALAKKYGIDEEQIREYNKLSESYAIGINETLIIPNGVMPQIIVPITTVASKTAVDIGKVFSTPAAENISTVVKGKSVGSGTMLWPTTWRVITQYYTPPRHKGLDIDGDYNSPIYSAEAGVVEWAGWKTGYGNCYIVNHGNGVKTLYAHLSKYFAKQGQQVARGDTLGMMGTTGWSTGTHLHFEVRINGAMVNPLSYIK
jgi:LysM repeat protein